MPSVLGVRFRTGPCSPDVDPAPRDADVIAETMRCHMPCRGWLTMLTELREQLQDDRGPLAREHWKHRHLYDALVRDVAALTLAVWTR